LLKSFAKTIFAPSTLNKLKKRYENIQTASLKKAVREQGFQDIYDKLSAIVPDIASQYTTFEINTPYLETKVRAQHSFQISLVGKALNLLDLAGGGDMTIVDIGDSAGTHIQYLQGLFGKFHALSVNLDEKAVEKIESKGLKAICARAEDLDRHGISADLFLSFEMIEHLCNPIDFLRSIAENTSCKGFVVTVPYLAQSRVGLHHIRQQNRKDVYAENTHIFELSPEDWRLIYQHSGWVVEYDQVYLQYPKRSWLRATKNLWRKNDFEGFYGAILTRDNTWSQLYKSW
jgi:hypothetical protein